MPVPCFVISVAEILLGIVLVTYVSVSPAVDQVCFSTLICVAEQIQNQVMLHLPFISNPTVTITFCRGYVAREVCRLAAFVEAEFYQ